MVCSDVSISVTPSCGGRGMPAAILPPLPSLPTTYSERRAGLGVSVVASFAGLVDPAAILPLLASVRLIVSFFPNTEGYIVMHPLPVVLFSLCDLPSVDVQRDVVQQSSFGVVVLFGEHHAVFRQLSPLLEVCR